MEGEFIKYINNNGKIGNPIHGKKIFYEKAEALAHFSYEDSDEKLLLVDLQGSGYNLYDPEIASAEDLENEENDDPEKLFCGGNLNEMAFDIFFTAHKCNIYCISLLDIRYSI